MTRDDANYHRENEALEHAIGHIFNLDHVAQIVEKGNERDVNAFVRKGDERAAQPADENGKNDQQWQSDRNRHQPRQHQVMDGIYVHCPQRVDFLIDLHRPYFSSHCRTDPAGNENGHHHGCEFFADSNTDKTANSIGQTPLNKNGTRMKSDNTANEEGEDAHHQQARITYLEELFEHLQSLAKCHWQREQRLPEQNHHFANVLKHMSILSANPRIRPPPSQCPNSFHTLLRLSRLRQVRLAMSYWNIKQFHPFAVGIGLILESAEQERELFGGWRIVMSI